MRGPLPKDPRLRQRKNRVSTAATLKADQFHGKIPELPRGRRWHAFTRDWWRDVWRSPMVAEYLESDRHGLYILADLIDRYWKAPSSSLAAEIRMQRQCFGLTPVDRRRLQWTVERAKMAEHKQLPKKPSERRDPRDLLHLVQGGHA